MLEYCYIGEPEVVYITYEYDEHDNMITKIEPDNTYTKYQYDDNGNKIRSINSYGYINEWKYDARGNVIMHTDVYGNTVTHEVLYYDNGQLKLYDDLHIPLI